MTEKEEELSLIRSEMQSALDTFLEHVKYTITLMSSVSAAGAALIAFCLQQNADVVVKILILALASACFWLVSSLSSSSYEIVQRYYKLYASNYIYSARMHKLAGSDVKHPWIEDLKTTGVINLDSDEAIVQFMSSDSGKEKHSWHYYKSIIINFKYIGYAGIAFSFLILIFQR